MITGAATEVLRIAESAKAGLLALAAGTGLQVMAPCSLRTPAGVRAGGQAQSRPRGVPAWLQAQEPCPIPPGTALGHGARRLPGQPSRAWMDMRASRVSSSTEHSRC